MIKNNKKNEKPSGGKKKSAYPEWFYKEYDNTFLGWKKSKISVHTLWVI